MVGLPTMGIRVALLAMTLACLEPNLVAHSSLVTTDVGGALFIVLAVYLLWEYLQRPRWWEAILLLLPVVFIFWR